MLLIYVITRRMCISNLFCNLRTMFPQIHDTSQWSSSSSISDMILITSYSNMILLQNGGNFLSTQQIDIIVQYVHLGRETLWTQRQCMVFYETIDLVGQRELNEWHSHYLHVGVCSGTSITKQGINLINLLS